MLLNASAVKARVMFLREAAIAGFDLPQTTHRLYQIYKDNPFATMCRKQ
jgi:hypothetical protein